MSFLLNSVLFIKLFGGGNIKGTAVIPDDNAASPREVLYIVTRAMCLMIGDIAEMRKKQALEKRETAIVKQILKAEKEAEKNQERPLRSIISSSRGEKKQKKDAIVALLALKESH